MVSLSFKLRISSGRNRWRDDVIPAEASDLFINNLFVDDLYVLYALHLKRLYLHSWHTLKTSLYVTVPAVQWYRWLWPVGLTPWSPGQPPHLGSDTTFHWTKQPKQSEVLNLWKTDTQNTINTQSSIHWGVHTSMYMCAFIVRYLNVCVCARVCTHTHTYIPTNLSNIALIMASLSAITFCDDLKCFIVVNEFQPCQEGVKCIRSAVKMKHAADICCVKHACEEWVSHLNLLV